ncbi:M28 family metallopeptidase [Pedobacter ureilyticus]|uniref:M28 family metallopeptidase n=1 Tax=Pedobacter ureilyticus TaxID=1393051 RepID=A0ABW9J4B7_9SPHI|nr:M28 family peptidase [Pedobacter helvus]
MYRFPLLLLITIIISFDGLAQDLNHAKKTINTLASKKYWGRGYTKNGMAKAADFIEKEFKKFGLTAVNGTDFKQEFTFAVNTFPGKMKVKLNGVTLKPGRDFIVHQASKGATTTDSLIKKDSITYLSKNGNIALSIQPKLTWSVAQKELDYTVIEVSKTAVLTEPVVIDVAIENKIETTFTAANVVGMIKGTVKPDSILMFTAHYDHLGSMGNKTYFPGANDNASGVAILLDLVKYYATNPPKYSIVFIAFAAEEAGLLGSKYFTQNPLVPLKNIRFLWNLDLMGNGDAGATVVNAMIHPQEFALLNKINGEKKYLLKINPRGKAANSDHYFFTEKGVPAFFLYTQGGSPAYHDVDDIAKNLPLTAYENLFKLFVGFNQRIIN